MSDIENDPNEVLRMRDPSALMREVATLREQLAKLERNNVVNGGFVGEPPRYLLNEPGFYDDTLFPAGSQIDYLDMPNLSMVPLNDPAKRRMAEHIEILETGARRLAAMRGRDFYGLVTDRNVLIDMARQDAQADAAAPIPVIQMPQPIGMVPAMPHTDEARAQARRSPGRPKKVVASSAPAAQRPDAGAPTLAPAPREVPAGPGSAVVGRMVS